MLRWLSALSALGSTRTTVDADHALVSELAKLGPRVEALEQRLAKLDRDAEAAFEKLMARVRLKVTVHDLRQPKF